MRTSDERTRLVLGRTTELRREKRVRRRRAASVACVVACVLLVVGLGLGMTGLMADGSAAVSQDDVVMASGVASMVASSGSLGYVLMGLLSFLLGVCLTVLLFHLRGRGSNDGAEDDDDEL